MSIELPHKKAGTIVEEGTRIGQFQGKMLSTTPTGSFLNFLSDVSVCSIIYCCNSDSANRERVLILDTVAYTS